MAPLERFGALLDEEYEALLAADVERLHAVVERKSALIPALAALGPPTAGSEHARDIAARNARNGTLIAERLADVGRRMAFFFPGAGEQAATYDCAGMLRPVSRPGRS